MKAPLPPKKRNRVLTKDSLMIWTRTLFSQMTKQQLMLSVRLGPTNCKDQDILFELELYANLIRASLPQGMGTLEATPGLKTTPATLQRLAQSCI